LLLFFISCKNVSRETLLFILLHTILIT